MLLILPKCNWSSVAFLKVKQILLISAVIALLISAVIAFQLILYGNHVFSDIYIYFIYIYIYILWLRSIGQHVSAVWCNMLCGAICCVVLTVVDYRSSCRQTRTTGESLCEMAATSWVNPAPDHGQIFEYMLLTSLFFLSFLFGVTHAPFACQRWGLPYRLAQCATPGKGLV